MPAAVFSMMFLVPAWADGLYQPGQFQSLTSDRRAYRPGDILTVQIVENSSAQTTADTKTEKNGAVNLALKTPSIDKSAAVQLSDQFSGGGSIQRSGRLLAQVTAVVQSVYPNGLLHVKGEQTIEMNNEKQEIRLEGNVRPVDITDGNTVLSTRIADAKISYIGDGILGEKQRPGILTRFLTWLGIL
jgi:flagellar L-ring protein precursor FlgH